MNYKIMLLAPSAGGKSTLMRYLREHSELNIVETDEEVTKANDGKWPSDDYKNEVLIPLTFKSILIQKQVLFLMKDLPIGLLREARSAGFYIVALILTYEQLMERNSKRMEEESYDDGSAWFKAQIEQIESYVKDQLVDEIIDGTLPIAQIAEKIIELAQS
jgi:dephospho-CoA kinase